MAQTTESKSLSPETRPASCCGEGRLHSPKILPVGMGRVEKRFSGSDTPRSGRFSEVFAADEKRRKPSILIDCDGAEPVVEDTHMVSLKSKRRFTEWLRFPDVPARNTFIFEPRLVSQQPSTSLSVSFFGEDLKQRFMYAMGRLITLCCKDPSVAISQLYKPKVNSSSEAVSTLQGRAQPDKKPCTISQNVVVPRLDSAALKQNTDDFTVKQSGDELKQAYNCRVSGTLDTIDAMSEGGESAWSESSDNSWCAGSNAEETSANNRATSKGWLW